MRGLIIVISCIILVFVVLDKSGAFRVTSYTVTERTLKVEKTRFEWHPEKLTFYFKTFSKKWRERFFKKGSSSPEVRKVKKKGERAAPSRLVLKSGAILKGRVIQKNKEGVLFESEGGEVFFSRDEIVLLETE